MPQTLDIALTFDDGPHSAGSQNLTRRVMSDLDARGIRAAFFIQSHALDINDTPIRGSSENGREVLADMDGDGHLICTHTGVEAYNPHQRKYRHTQRETDGKLGEDLDNAQDLIEEETNQSAEFVRPPGGFYNDDVIARYTEHDLQFVYWDIDPERGAGKVKARILANIKSQIEDYLEGDDKTQMVVLLHDIQSSVAYHLLDYIQKIEEVVCLQGYTPNFHHTKSELKAILRNQHDAN